MNREKEIQNELNAISHVVADVPFENPYTLAADYFDNTAESITAKINTDHQIQAEDTSEDLFSLASIPTQFEVPNNYFENNPESIIQRIHSSEKSSSKYIPLFIKLSVAAICIGLLGWMIFNGLNHSSSSVSTQELAEAARIVKSNSFEKEMDSLDDNEIISYLDASGHDVKTALVASLTTENNLPSPEEYIFDEKTLDNYLLSVNVQH